MKGVVTGGSGFIGSHLTQALIDAGWEVAVLDNRRPSVDVTWLRADVRDDLGDAFAGYDYVFHLAALANARKCRDKPELCAAINITGTANTLRAARKAGVKRFVLASSAWIAGAQTANIADESTPLDVSQINTIYGASKLAQEALCIAFHSEFGQPPYTILRYGTQYGERMWAGLVVRAFMQMAESTGRIAVMGDGKQFREFVYVRDLCAAHIALENRISSNKIYNLTGDTPVTIERVAQEIIKYYPAKLEYVPQARSEPTPKRARNDLAKRELGWSLKTSLEEGIRNCVEWWQALPADKKMEDYWC